MLKMKSIEFDIIQIVLPIIYILIGILINKKIKRINSKTKNVSYINLNPHKPTPHHIKILNLNLNKYITVILVTLAILSTYGINVKSILAGLGITTAIIGLAFQDLAKDLIAGIAIIT